MNITSAVVGISLMGTAMPMVANMTIQPLMAQKRAENFAVAESAAVGYEAKNEGVPALTPLPDNCSTAELEVMLTQLLVGTVKDSSNNLSLVHSA